MRSTEIQERVEQTLRDLQGIAFEAGLFRDAFANSPTPTWYKEYRNGRFVMVAVNAAYTRLTGISLKAYRGQIDEAVWPAETAAQYSDNDQEVMRRRVMMRIAEPASNPITGEPEYWVGWKYPHIVKGECRGVFGKARPWPEDIWDALDDELKARIQSHI